MPGAAATAAGPTGGGLLLASNCATAQHWLGAAGSFCCESMAISYAHSYHVLLALACTMISFRTSYSRQLALLALAALNVAAPIKARACSEVTVVAPAPFMGNDGEVVKFSDNSYWQVSGSYEYLYAYYPTATLCPSTGKLLIQNKTLRLTPVSNTARETPGEEVVETSIVSQFGGLKRGNIYRMANGQIWEQTESWAWVWVWVQPAVMIYQSKGGYAMSVENIDHPVAVRRIK